MCQVFNFCPLVYYRRLLSVRLSVQPVRKQELTTDRSPSHAVTERSQYPEHAPEISSHRLPERKPTVRPVGRPVDTAGEVPDDRSDGDRPGDDH